MPRYIDADALIAEREEEIVDYDEDLQKHFIVKAVPTEYIEDFPAADVEEVRHGAWINECILDDEWYHTCSNCNVEIRVTFFDFRCPNCGTKMDGKI